MVGTSVRLSFGSPIRHLWHRHQFPSIETYRRYLSHLHAISGCAITTGFGRRLSDHRSEEREPWQSETPAMTARPRAKPSPNATARESCGFQTCASSMRRSTKIPCNVERYAYARSRTREKRYFFLITPLHLSTSISINVTKFALICKYRLTVSVRG